MIREESQVLFENAARSVGSAPRESRLRHSGDFLKADRACGQDVADALGIALSEAPA